MSKSTKLWIAACTLLFIGLVVVISISLNQRQEMQGFIQQMDIEKEELEDEFSQLSIQYEGYQMELNNDSLIQQLDTEQMKVQRLREELRTVKSTNLQRINELKKELATLRTIMRNYVIQIDSLNTINEQLTQENKSVKQEYNKISSTANQLKKEKERLTEQVTQASKLDAVGIEVKPLDKRKRKTDRISRAERFEINFTIAKNVTAPVGEIYIYARIVKPDGDVLVKSRTNLFTFEDGEINYSSRKLIEYTSEEQEVSIYWDIEEFLYPGNYRIELFADNFLIGEKGFSLEK